MLLDEGPTDDISESAAEYEKNIYILILPKQEKKNYLQLTLNTGLSLLLKGFKIDETWLIALNRNLNKFLINFEEFMYKIYLITTHI